MNPAAAQPPDRNARSASYPSWLFSATLLGLICIAALLLRLHLLGLKCFWVDEGVSGDLAIVPWRVFAHRLWVWEGNMSLYYLLLRFWAQWGSSDAWIRSLSVLSAVLTVPCIYLLGKHLFGQTAGWIAAVLLAVHAFHIEYSQEARSYSLLVLLAVISTQLFVLAVESPTSKRWLAYALVSALAVYVHFYAPLLVLAHLAALLFLPRENIPWKRLLWAGALYVALVWPAVVYVFLNRATGQLDWLRAPNALVLWNFALLFAGSGGPALLAAYLLACSAAFASSYAGAQGPAAHSGRFPLALVSLWLFLPPAVLLGVSWSLKGIFMARYGTLVLPALILLASAGIASLRPGGRWAASLALLLLSLYGVRTYFRERYVPYEDWRSAAAYVVQHAHPGDAMLFNAGVGRIAFNRYARRLPGGASLSDVFPDFDSSWQRMAATIAAAARTHERVWVVEWEPSKMLSLLVEKRFSAVEKQHFPRVNVSLYVRTPGEQSNADHLLPYPPK